MAHASLSKAIGRVSALQGTYQTTCAPCVRAGHQRAGEHLEIVGLQSKSAEWIASERIEPGGNEDKVRNEAFGGAIDSTLECIDVLSAGETRGQRNIPDRTARSAVIGGPSSRVPGPLVHGDEMDIGLVLDERLSAVAVMHVPIDDEYPFETVVLPSVVRGQRDVSKEAEAHRAVEGCVVPGWADRGKASWMYAANCEINRGEHASRSGRSCQPGSTARHGVSVEAAAALLDDISHGADVVGIVRQLQFFDGRVASLDVLDGMEKFWILSQRPGYCAESPDVFRMSPAGVVTATVAVRDERGPHGPKAATRPVADGGR
jgi:hypothetical protein